MDLQYYKPWELLPSEDVRIKSQIEAAEDTIQRATAQFDSETTEATTGSQPVATAPSAESKLDPEQGTEGAMETVGSESNIPQEADSLGKGGDTDKQADPSPSEPEPASTEQQDSSKDHEDDGGEMVEADEDMVIY